MSLVRSVLADARTYRLARLVLAGFFLLAGVIKLADPPAFAATIKAFAILPGEFVGFASYVIPLLEIAAAVGLIWDVKGSLSIIVGLLGVFIGVLVYAIRLGLDIDCGCYGPGDPEGEAFHSIWSSLYRDLFLAGLAAFIAFWRLARKPRLRSAWAIVAKRSATRKEDCSCAR